MIVCVGEALVDVFPGGREVPGGGPMNAAVAAARLGAPVAFVGRVSTDNSGARIWGHMENSGVNLAAAQRGPEPTARAVVEPGPVFRFEGEGTADESMVGVELGPLGSGPHLIHGGTLGIFRGATAGVLADIIDHHDGLVSFDPNVRPQIIESRAQWLEWANRWVARAELIKASDEDLEWMGLEPAALLDRGARVVVRTAGGAGAEVFLASGEHLQVSAQPVEVVDTVGAGDSFIAAILVRLWELGITDGGGLSNLDGASWREIIGFANSVAAVTVSRPGADPPLRSELG